MVRCKVRCDNVSPVHANATNEEIGAQISENLRFSAVYSSDPDSENKKWSLMTPCFNLTKTIDNPACFGKFEQGKEYYVDFTPA